MPTKTTRTKKTAPRRAPARKKVAAKKTKVVAAKKSKAVAAKKSRSATPSRYWKRALERNLILEGYSRAEAKELVALAAS